MECEPLVGFVLRHRQRMSLVMLFEARYQLVVVLCRVVIDDPTLCFSFQSSVPIV
jgi:hypothetical protein